MEVGTGKTYTTIQSAVNAASSGDAISVYPGTYTENVSLTSPSTKTNITIQSVSGAAVTIIDGNANGTAVNMASTCTLDGFTIQNGSGTAIEDDGDNINTGGGILCLSLTNVTVQNCIITNNTLTVEGFDEVYGAGMATFSTTNTNIFNCTFSSNSIEDSDEGTAGFHAGVLSGPEVSSSTITDCVFNNNGGTGLLAVFSATVSNCTFSNNLGSMAGAVLADGTHTITNCLFYSNGENGLVLVNEDEVSTYTVTNCTFVNSTDNAIILSGKEPISTATIKNCILYGSGGYGISERETGKNAIPINCCFYNNTTGLFFHENSDSLTLAQINALSGASGNIAVDPLFTDVTNNDYTLQNLSPCIDAGTSTGAPATDLDGNTRPQGGGYDIGCYEYVSDLATTWYLSENCTANGFYEFVTVLNPNSTDATIDMTVYKPDGTTIQVPDLTVPATKRSTFAINSLADGLTGFGLKVESTNSVTIAVERLVYKASTTPGVLISPNDWILGTNSIAAADTATTWFFGEGATHSGYQVFLALTNPNSTDAIVTFTFIPDDTAADDIIKTATVPATSRLTYNVNTSVSELASYNGFGTKVVSDQAIVVERAMYSNTNLNEAVWGHCSVGATTTATTLYSPEGSIQTNYTTDLLLLNPGATDAIVTLTFIPEGGTADDNVIKTETVTANSRLTYNINSNVSELSSYDGFATKVVSDQPIAAERVMYGPGPTKTWGHVSKASQTTGTTWYLPEGSIQTGVYDYIVLMNPGTTTATATLTFMPDDATADNVNKTVTIAAGSRTTYSVNSGASELSSYDGFGTKITSDEAIVAGQSVYGGDAVGNWTWAQSSIGIVE